MGISTRASLSAARLHSGRDALLVHWNKVRLGQHTGIVVQCEGRNQEGSRSQVVVLGRRLV